MEQAEAFRQCYRIRRVEEVLPELKAQGAVQGSLHLCNGQEAVPVGAAAGTRYPVPAMKAVYI